MSQILNPDNRFFNTINKIIDVSWISLIWSIMCLPLFTLVSVLGMLDPQTGLIPDEMLFTVLVVFAIEMLAKSVLIGPATSALYYVMVKVIRRSRSYATREFFHAFKMNFKVAAPLSVLLVVFSLLMIYDILYADALMNAGEKYGIFLFIVFVFTSVLALMVLLWSFPILSRFTIGFKKLVKMALYIGARHVVRSLMMIAFIVAYFVIILEFLPLYLYILIPIAVPGTSMLVRSFIIEPVLKQYTAEAEGTEEETGEDRWYTE